MKNFDDLKKELYTVQKKLNTLIESGEPLDSDRVLQLSQELDKFIAEYQKYVKNKNW